jgi:hypothetical protein
MIVVSFDGSTASVVMRGAVLRGRLTDVLCAVSGSDPSPILVPAGVFKWLDATAEESTAASDGSQVTRSDIEESAASLNAGRPVLVDREHESVFLSPRKAETLGWAHRAVLVERTDRNRELHMFLRCELLPEVASDIESGKWPFGSVYISKENGRAQLMSHAITRYPVQSTLLPSTAVRSQKRGQMLRALKVGKMPEEQATAEATAETVKRALSAEDEALLVAKMAEFGIDASMPFAEQLDALIAKIGESFAALPEEQGEPDHAMARAVKLDGEVKVLRSQLEAQRAQLQKQDAVIGQYTAEQAERKLRARISGKATAKKIAITDAQVSEIYGVVSKIDSESTQDAVIDVSLRALNLPTSETVIQPEAPKATVGDWKVELEKRASVLRAKGVGHVAARVEALRSIVSERPDLAPVISGEATGV